MRLVQLIYASRSEEPQESPDELRDILDQSLRSNDRAGVTGLLAYGDGRFLQCLEGDRDEVNAIYSKIVADERHRDPTVIQCREISARAFADVPMKLVIVGDRDREAVRKSSGSERFDPFSMEAESAMRLLLELHRLEPGERPSLNGRGPAHQGVGATGQRASAP